MSFVAIHALKKLLIILSGPVVKLVRRAKENETEEMAKVEGTIAIEHICKVIFHGSFAVYAYTVFSGKEWVPWYLGGSNDIRKLCEDYPFTELDPKIYMFMLVSLG